MTISILQPWQDQLKPDDPLTGIVYFVADVVTYRSDPEVFVAVSQSADTRRYGFPENAIGSGSGAGLTNVSARGAAVGEAVERYVSCVADVETAFFGSATEAKRQELDPVGSDEWALFAPGQPIPKRFSRFDDDVRIVWTSADSITQRRCRLIPASLVLMPYVCRHEDEQIVALAISTGTACARSRSEALIRGIYEVIERDAFIINWQNSVRMPKVTLDSDDADDRELMRRFFRPGLEYRVYLTTLDLQVPSFFGLLIDWRRHPPAVMAGGAAHHDAREAYVKTLLELVQGLKWLDEAPKKAPARFYDDVRSFDDRMALYAFGDMVSALEYLEGGSQLLLRDVRSPILPSVTSVALKHISDLLASRGIEILAVDLTTSDIESCGLNVVRVICPQCQPMEGDHCFPFLGGKRLASVPEYLGLECMTNYLPHPYP